MRTLKHPLFHLTSIGIAVGILTACGGGENNPTPAALQEDDTNIVTIDATAGGFGAAVDAPDNKYAYFNLTTKAIVELTDAQATTSNDWHIAFKRTSFKLNGGVSGPGNVNGAVADAQDDFYDTSGDPDNSVFLNANAANELTSLDAVTTIDDLSFVEDRNVPYVKGDGSSDGWWLYAGLPSHAITANSEKWWLIKSAAGDSYAKLNVSNIEQASRDITLELFIQNAADSVFSTTAISWTAAIGEAGGAKCFDIDTAVEMDCITAASDWDIKVEVDGRDWNIWTNGSVFGSGSGGAFGSFDSAGISGYVSGTNGPGGDSIARFYRTDSTGGLFKDNTWYAYNLESNSKLWPNYRVYVIDTGIAKYKLQILSYYGDAGISGMIKLRYKEL